MIRSHAAQLLFDHFINELEKIGAVEIHPHKTMISISRGKHGVAYVTQAGKNFIHIVFSFKQRYDDNLCFQRIQEVPGRRVIYHHFRMLHQEDINDEVRKFMRISYYGIT